MLQRTAGPGSSAAPQSALQGISGIKVDPRDFEETTKRWGLQTHAAAYTGACTSATLPKLWYWHGALALCAV